MYYWCVAMHRKESSLTLLILSTHLFKSIKSTLHWQTLSAFLLAQQRLGWKEATMYCTIKAASNYATISSLTTLSFIEIMFNQKQNFCTFLCSQCGICGGCFSDCVLGEGSFLIIHASDEKWVRVAVWRDDKWGTDEKFDGGFAI